MNLADSVAIHKYHLDRIRAHGAESSKVLGWKTAEGQETRYKVLCEIGDLSNCSVLDVGCGHGDLRGYLEGKYTGLRYLGIDQVEPLLEVAIKKYGHLPETSFFLGDFSAAELPVTDYILACGALSYRSSDPDFIFKIITKLFQSCRIGFGFNLLRNIHSQDGILVAYDPETILQHCRALTANVILKEGYYEEDFTVIMNY
jgi:SAM-dependent methyltransferase